MKFAKELEQDLVPEWRAKYLDYKLGKKKVKTVARAYRNLSQTPKTPGRRRPANLFSSASYQLPIQNQSPFALDGSLDDTVWGSRAAAHAPKSSSRNSNTLINSSQGVSNSTDEGDNTTYYDGTPPLTTSDRQPLRQDYEESNIWDSGAVTNYGSIIASPPRRPALGPPMLELPDPAISPTTESFPRHNRAWRRSKLGNDATPATNVPTNPVGDAYAVGKTRAPPQSTSSLLPKPRNFLKSRGTFPTPDGLSLPHQSPFLRRMFSVSGAESPSSPDVPLEAYRDFDMRQADFFAYLDKELEKIETFYKMKESEANDRLKVLRQQLHEMRDRRQREIVAAQEAKEHARQEHERHLSMKVANEEEARGDSNGKKHLPELKWMKPIGHAIEAGGHQFGRGAKALESFASPSGPSSNQYHDSWRDFTRRPQYNDEVPYRVAKKKLKLALQEFYRALELLKSYALLNRTAFRKINKKYDKAVNARPTGRYISEKVNKAWFVQSEVLDGHIVAVEDLYARYFERGNHKIAVGKLRVKHGRDGAFNGSTFRNGLCLAGGAILAIEALVYSQNHLSDPDPVVQVNSSYLLQLYGGYFLALFLFLLFCVDCSIWTRAKINYIFIFEFDTRHNLDWRQLAELPSLFFFLLGLSMWLNFHQSGADTMFLYWPVVLVGLTVLIMFLPAPLIYYRSRQWWAYSNFRLLLAGLYPVEFRDFFLGDMYCSQTYAMGNLELFFCLYAQGWNNPTQCNSTHARLLGFFSTLPGIWRALQCLRRYYDTRNAFPHLVNCGKYMFTILFYMSLSIYRIDEQLSTKVFFIVCATVNSIYCSVWDVAMDWSLGNPWAKNPYLRDVLGYKRPWVYYFAMFLDPILRFNWIFYAIFESELQHSAILSFFVGLSEICRRGMWSLFRVENEHCTNVGRFRASRDVPLPYDIPSHEHLGTDTGDNHDHPVDPDHTAPHPTNEPSRPHAASGADLESQTTNDTTLSSGTIRRRRPGVSPSLDSPIQRGIARVGTLMAAAHAQDFERKRRPALESGEGKESRHDSGGSSDEDEMEGVDASIEQEIYDAGDILDRHRSATHNGGDGRLRSE